MISPTVIERVSAIPNVTKVPHKMASLKDVRAAVEEGGCTIWGQLPDIPYMSENFGLGFTEEGQRVVSHTRAGRPPFCVSNNRVNAIEDADSDCDFDNWIFPTIGNRLDNWKAKDIFHFSFIHE